MGRHTRTAIAVGIALLVSCSIVVLPVTGEQTSAAGESPLAGANATVQTVSVTAAPAPAPPGARVDLSATSPNATRYAWDLDGDGIAERVGQTVTWRPSESGEAVVAVRATNSSNDVDDYAEASRSVVISETRYLNARAGADDRLSARDLGAVVRDFAAGRIRAATVGAAITRWASQG